jgi:hypothetical protein
MGQTKGQRGRKASQEGQAKNERGRQSKDRSQRKGALGEGQGRRKKPIVICELVAPLNGMREFEEFVAPLSKWKEAYTQVVRSYVGVKTSKGLNLYYGRIFFETNGSAVDKAPFGFETDHFVAGRCAKAIAGDAVFAAIEKAIKTGEMEGLKEVIPLALDGSSNQLSVYLNDYEVPFLPRLFVRGASFHGLRSGEGFPRHLERELQSADMPYQTLDDLLNHCGLPSTKTIGDLTTLEIVAAAPGLIDRSSQITGGAGVIQCRLSNRLPRNKVKLGWCILHKDKKTERESAMGNAIQWHDDGDKVVGTVKVTTAEAPFLRVYLSYDSIVIDEHPLIDEKQRPNLRHEVHRAFDPGYNNLRESLIGAEVGRGNTFETAVSALLTLLGFSVTHYGSLKRLQDGPDIIAITPSGCVAIIECTVGLIDQKGKIAKLVRRKQLVEARLAKTGGNVVQCQAVIFTPLPRDEVKADLSMAGSNEIAVVCKEDIEQFLNRIAFSDDADAAFSEIRTLIPISHANIGSFVS